MKLSALLNDIRTRATEGDLDTAVTGIRADSRDIRRGDLFVALRGASDDGRRFIPEAVHRGAVAVMYGSPDSSYNLIGGLGVPEVLVEDPRLALAAASSAFYGRPSERLDVVGITGTNGKTTTAFILRSILQGAGREAGLIGTIGSFIKDEAAPALLTTPEAPEFQAFLSRLLGEGIGVALTEVSSHALSLGRVDFTRFKVALFTNLSRDHLDFHESMDNYMAAKSRLFGELLAPEGRAVINADDPRAAELISISRAPVLLYGFGPKAELRGEVTAMSPAGLEIRATYNGEAHALRSALVGEHNAYNILGAVGVALALGLGWDEISRGVAGAGQVPGRFERIEAGQDFMVVVDYAHTDDALRRLITAARAITPSTGRIITLFGCGGERDTTKRPAMGAVASELSESVIVTSDNPRGEDPERIIAEITAGMSGGNYEVIADRREAIAHAVGSARAGDTVLIAGKGHEDYQIVGNTRHHLSDSEEVVTALKGRLGRI